MDHSAVGSVGDSDHYHTTLAALNDRMVESVGS
jgi:hypothetical protein